MTIINTTSGSGVVKTIAGEEKPSSFPSTYPAPSGYDGWSQLTIDAPDNLVASNIKEGVEIAGVTGTYGADIKLTTEEGIVTSFPMTYATPAGYDGMSAVIAHAPENFTADNIRKGVTIANVTGTYEGSSSAGIAALCDGSITTITEEDLAGVTKLRNYGIGWTKLSSITIPDTVVSIGESCFVNSYYLNEISIPDSVTSIGSACFQNCYSLRKVELSSNLTKLESMTFFRCGLEKITVPSGVTDIGSMCFNNCSSLTSLILLPTTPPTLNSTSLSGTPSNMVITVPKGTLDAYKAATNWSAYATKMVEASE